MARLAATAVLLLSLLAVASCRVLEAEPEAVIAISDELSQAEPAITQETDAAEAIPSVPTVAVGEVEGILRLPSHRRPCRHGFLHRHLRWARHHGLSHRRGDFSGAGDARVLPAFLPEEPREAELEAVTEPDPDSRPHADGEEVEEKDVMKPPTGDVDGGEENELVKAWKGEMLRRFRGHGLRFHHRHHHHHHEQAMAGENDESEHQEEKDMEQGAGDMQLKHVKMFSRHFHHHHGDEEQEQPDKEEGAEGMPVAKLFSRHSHHHHCDDEQEDTTRKHYFHHHHDSDNEVDEVEYLARRLTKAIMRRSFRRGGSGIRHHLHHHRAEEGGVRKWFRSLINMNRL